MCTQVASTSIPEHDTGDLADVSPFASHTEPLKHGPGNDRADRNTAEGSGGGLNGATHSQSGIAPQTSVPTRASSVARQVSWHDFHGKNLVEVREFEPRCVVHWEGL